MSQRSEKVRSHIHIVKFDEASICAAIDVIKRDHKLTACHIPITQDEPSESDYRISYELFDIFQRSARLSTIFSSARRNG
jgi:hypothetical protein